MLFAPLMSNGVPIGLIGVTRTEPGSFADHHVQLLQTFADQAVIAIENVRLFNETKEALERQTATADILKVIASSPSDVQPVFEAIATSANRLFGGLSTAVYRLRRRNVHLAAFTPISPEADAVAEGVVPSRSTDRSLAEQIRATASSSMIRDTEAIPRCPPPGDGAARGFRSLLRCR